MKIMSIVIIVLAALVGLFATSAIAQEPPLPHAFYGTVEINHQPADVGTQIEARGEGILTNIEGNPIVVTESGKYGGAGPLEPKLIVQGNIVEGTILTFYINGIAADQTAEWHTGAVTELDLTITTGLNPPTVTTDPVTAIDSMAATLHGSLSNLGDSSVVDVSFQWGTTTAYGSETDAQQMTSTGSFNATLSGLAPDTSYHFRAKAVGEGTTYGVDRTFTTAGTTNGDTGNGDITPEDNTGDTLLPTVSDMSISPTKVNIGETVTISVLVTNNGSQAAICTITLKINGVEEAIKEETINAGASKEVTFTTVKDVAGSYPVNVNGLSGSFTVKEKETPISINWPILGGVIVGVVIMGLLIILIKVRRRAHW